jgi:two-component system sensor histidine kinase QseC
MRKAEAPGLSLRWRLIALTLGAVALAWLVTALLTYRDARKEMGEIMDAHLAQAAALLIAQTSREIEEIETEHAPTLHRRARSVAFQLWEKGRTLRLHSSNAPQSALATAAEGFSDREVEGKRWRVFTGWDAKRNVLVHVGELQKSRDELAEDLAEGMLKPLLFALPLLGLLLWVAVRKGIQPLDGVIAQLAERAPDHLGPLSAQRLPADVAPLVGRLNVLLGRVERQMDQERRFTADAAHELRTPLAATRAQAQVARAAGGDPERTLALDAVIAGCDRATHLVEQLLTLAQVDADGVHTDESVPLRHLAETVLAELAPAALDKSIDLELPAGPEIAVRGQREWLGILLRNLVDNAVRYTPAHGRVRVVIERQKARPALIVTDTGPGIPEQERARVRERFYRVLGSGASGSGLGLSIVDRIAAIHGAGLRLESGNRGTGLKAVVLFPPS